MHEMLKTSAFRVLHRPSLQNNSMRALFALQHARQDRQVASVDADLRQEPHSLLPSWRLHRRMFQMPEIKMHETALPSLRGRVATILLPVQEHTFGDLLL